MYRIIIFFLFQVSVFSILSAQETIYVKAQPGDATPRLQNAIEQARHLKGKKVVIQLEQGNYDLYRNSSSKRKYNTPQFYFESCRSFGYGNESY